MTEEDKPQAFGKRIKINVGGTIFETYISTLTRVNGSMLSALVSERWRNEKELFVDRNPTLFAQVLDYLRDGDHFLVPIEDGACEALRREAEFYNLSDLAKTCSPKEIRVGDVVKWKENAIESYWKVFVSSHTNNLVGPSTHLDLYFTKDKDGKEISVNYELVATEAPYALHEREDNGGSERLL